MTGETPQREVRGGSPHALRKAFPLQRKATATFNRAFILTST
ncbi:hypothetical protein KP77_30690 [Jeotgalibacillus alimentarius]|uniref:Uncharacterized protein n=1 Tax=Jeotgalibacillus alimentarius TaxID=135826 RepID=A0A0C2VH87_9BACL|nr:hypothetical protein KP77_30690 [Jeotgalibacillus alimentarius]